MQPPRGTNAAKTTTVAPRTDGHRLRARVSWGGVYASTHPSSNTCAYMHGKQTCSWPARRWMQQTTASRMDWPSHKRKERPTSEGRVASLLSSYQHVHRRDGHRGGAQQCVQRGSFPRRSIRADEGQQVSLQVMRDSRFPCKRSHGRRLLQQFRKDVSAKLCGFTTSCGTDGIVLDRLPTVRGWRWCYGRCGVVGVGAALKVKLGRWWARLVTDGVGRYSTFNDND